MKRHIPDVDIDTASSFEPGDIFPDVILASRVEKGIFKKHPCGVYFQNIPKDKITGMSAIPYKEAEELGFMKLDFLHLGIYDNFKSRKEIEVLVNVEPDWELLNQKEVVENLFQLSNHWNVVDRIKPRDVNSVADTLSIIRPGKRILLDRYIAGQVTREELYRQDNSGYTFKRSHAIGYAHVIKLQLHLIKAL